MHRRSITLLLLLAIVATSATTTFAGADELRQPVVGLKAPGGPPQTLSYQGRLTDAAGNDLPDGTYDLRIRIWDDSLAGNMLWEESFPVTTQGGIFSAVLGKITPITVDFAQPLWVSLEVDDPGELTPRLELTSSPYTFLAETVCDDAITSPKIASGTVVRSLNGMTDTVNLVPGSNVSITPAGNNLIIDATGGGAGADSDWQIAGNDMYSLPTGNVGVGTAAPGHDLHVVGSGINGTQFKVEDTTTAFSFQIATMWLETPYALGQLSMTTTDNGNKTMLLYAQTLGTDLQLRANDELFLNYGSQARIQMNGQDFAEFDGQQQFVMIDAEETDTVVLRPNDPTGSHDGGELLLNDASGNNTIRLDAHLDNNRGAGLRMFDSQGVQTVEFRAQKNASEDGAALVLYDELANPTVQVLAQNALGGGGNLFLFHQNGATTLQVEAQEDGSATQGASMKFYNDSGELTVEIDGDQGSSNQGRVITDVLEITGGADLSEQFDVQPRGMAVKPGLVVSIDPRTPGELAVSERSYDTRVAGVISGANGVRPGMLMGQTGSEADGEHPVALTGRVYVHADASQGAIEPGDLLTTSDVPGHAMKVADPSRAHGAILGKAMTSLESGRGLVLVLVSLQ